MSNEKVRGMRLCYLCGELLGDVGVNNDHVPPRQFFPHGVRRQHNLDNLLTLPTHVNCNRSYARDEDYFAHTLAPVMRGSYAGDELYRDVVGRVASPDKRALGLKVLEEFERRPSGLVLPGGKVVKRYDGERVGRVLWKITRGLFFNGTGRFVREDTPRKVIITSPGERPPDVFFALDGVPSEGRYPGVFDYKYRVVSELNDFEFWGLLFWDKLIVVVAFHAPDCACDTCSKPAETGLW